MKPEELRIGNLIRDIQSGRIEYILTIGEKKCTVKMPFSKLNQSFEDFEPIDITEDWLMKFGFIRQPWGLVIGELLFKDKNHECKELTLEVGNGFRTTIEYVHQLQNIYYSLCGEELTIKNE